MGCLEWWWVLVVSFGGGFWWWVLVVGFGGGGFICGKG